MKPHDYRHLDNDSKLVVELDLREAAERVVGMNYGVHRFLSHLIDVRRAAMRKRAMACRERGDTDIADAIYAQGDKLADGIEKLLLEGLY